MLPIYAFQRTAAVGAAPTVSSAVNAIGTSVGDLGGGYTVTITGTNFTGATGVTFGGTAATSVVVVNATTITCVAPAKAAGTYTVAVTTPGGTGSLASAFEYWSPAQLSLSVWVRASYSAAPWAGTASLGGSGSVSLQDLAAVPPVAGTAVNGRTPASFAAGTGQRLYGPNSNAVFAASAGTVIVLARAATAGSDSALTVNVRGLWSTQGSGDVQMGHSTAGLRFSVYDGVAYREAPAIAVGTGSWFVAAGRYNGSAAQARIGAGAFASNSVAAGNAALNASPTYLGSSQAPVSFDGDVLEGLAAAAVLTDADVTRFRGYAATRYSLSV